MSIRAQNTCVYSCNFFVHKVYVCVIPVQFLFFAIITKNLQESQIRDLNHNDFFFARVCASVCACVCVFFNNCSPVRMDYTTSLLEYTVNTSDYTTQPLKQSSHTGHRCALVTELTSKLCGSSVLPNALLCCLPTITGSR